MEHVVPTYLSKDPHHVMKILVLKKDHIYTMWKSWWIYFSNYLES